jgi:predicted ATPase
MLNNNYYILTGAMGSGKSTVINELKDKTFTCIKEPAREILAEQRLIDGLGVPDKDPNLFCQLLLSRSIYQYKEMAANNDKIIFDRGIPDCVAYAKYFDLNKAPFISAANTYRYNPSVFFLPAWQEIYVNDEERKMNFDESRDFGEKLKNFYLSLNYQIIEVPKLNPADRVNFIMEYLHA